MERIMLQSEDLLLQYHQPPNPFGLHCCSIDSFMPTSSKQTLSEESMCLP